MPNRVRDHFQPQFRAMGGVSVGNEFNKRTNKEAQEPLEAAWALGVRYFDVAPCYTNSRTTSSKKSSSIRTPSYQNDSRLITAFNSQPVHPH